MINLFPLELDCGEGSVLTETIYGILPHQSAKNISWVYTTWLPDPIQVKGNAKDLCDLWNGYLVAELEEGDAEDE